LLIVFDWDGTLMNSMDKIIACMQRAIEELGLEYREPQSIKEIIGLSLLQAAKSLYPDISLESMDQLRLSFKRHFLLAEQYPCSLYDGVAEGLEVLRSNGHSLAVATGKNREGLDAVLQNLGWQNYFDATRCADEAKSKPHPLMLLQLLSEFNVPTDQAIMVGDTAYDLDMASSAGVVGVAMTYGAHDYQRLIASKPAQCFGQFNEFLEWEQSW
jgi:phosphoglycolate phosphatase